jgi:hypothetical protein
MQRTSEVHEFNLNFTDGCGNGLLITENNTDITPGTMLEDSFDFLANIFPSMVGSIEKEDDELKSEIDEDDFQICPKLNFCDYELEASVLPEFSFNFDQLEEDQGKKSRLKYLTSAFTFKGSPVKCKNC